MGDEYEYMDAFFSNDSEQIDCDDGKKRTKQEMARDGWRVDATYEEEKVRTYKRRKGHGRGEERSFGGEDSGKVLSGN